MTRTLFSVLICASLFSPAAFSLTIHHSECSWVLKGFVSTKHIPEFNEIPSSLDTRSFFNDEYLEPQDEVMSWKKSGSFKKNTKIALKRVVKRKEVLGHVRPFVASSWTDNEEFDLTDLAKYFEPGKRYTFVITDSALLFAETGPAFRRNLLSKHVVLADFGLVRFAGEIWFEDGVLHFDNSSGTYLPPDELISAAYQYLETLFGQGRVVGHIADKALL